ncbi:MAG TPA: hypothetical protein PLA20_04820 [Bacilli bacterium]|jgi:phosphoserine aminotransferase|nr:MAG: hypothetical protein BWX94_01247 [Tenericutes bacterium ADurb.Bin140]HON64036.1 hypothetical protein [Bacilli bacterium]HOR96171.1 hypothetical protein [Bacilli bacterium]HPK58866.1 hypothetical protein [Bacilli bacterium]
MSSSVEMIAIKTVLKYFEEGLTSSRAIGRITKISKNTVSAIITKAKAQNITYHQIKDLDDDKIYKMFYPNNTNIKYVRPEPDVDKIIDELRKTPS